MVRFTRVISIVSFGFSVLGFVGFFIMLVSQKSLISFFGSDALAAQTEGTFFFPVSIFIRTLFLLASGILLFIFGGKPKYGFWPEIVVMSVNVVLLFTETLVSMYQNIITGRMGTQMLAAYSSLVSGFFNVNLILSITVLLIVLSCGLGIATKFYERRVRRTASA